jgi:hypothetical protein
MRFVKLLFYCSCLMVIACSKDSNTDNPANAQKKANIKSVVQSWRTGANWEKGMIYYYSNNEGQDSATITRLYTVGTRAIIKYFFDHNTRRIDRIDYGVFPFGDTTHPDWQHKAIVTYQGSNTYPSHLAITTYGGTLLKEWTYYADVYPPDNYLSTHAFISALTKFYYVTFHRDTVWTNARLDVPINNPFAQIPGYIKGEEDSHTFLRNGNDVLHYVYGNGRLETYPIDNFTTGTYFVPSGERKMRFTKAADTTILSVCKTMDPAFDNPWIWILEANADVQLKGPLDLRNQTFVPEMASSTYTDSLLYYSYAYPQVQSSSGVTYTNEITKDKQGRIITYIRSNNKNKPMMKYDFTYWD